MITENHAEQLSILSRQEHAHCIICGAANQQGLRLQFSELSDGSVKTVFPCQKVYQGYSGILHGGVISCLLDGSMTNCLFSKGITASTGELVLRFLHPVATDRPAVIRARIRRSRSPLYILEAELSQGAKMCARATGKFMERRSELRVSDDSLLSDRAVR